MWLVPMETPSGGRPGRTQAQLSPPLCAMACDVVSLDCETAFEWTRPKELRLVPAGRNSMAILHSYNARDSSNHARVVNSRFYRLAINSEVWHSAESVVRESVRGCFSQELLDKANDQVAEELSESAREVVSAPGGMWRVSKLENRRYVSKPRRFEPGGSEQLETSDQRMNVAPDVAGPLPPPYLPHGYAVGPNSEGEPDEVGAESVKAKLTFVRTAPSTTRFTSSATPPFYAPSSPRIRSWALERTSLCTRRGRA